MRLTKADRVAIVADMGEEWAQAAEYAANVLGNFVYLNEVFWDGLAEAFSKFEKGKANVKTFLVQRIRFAALKYSKEENTHGACYIGDKVTVSLNSLIDDGEGKSELQETVFEPLDKLADEVAMLSEDTDKVSMMLDTLTDSEKFVIVGRFWQGKKLREIAQELNISAERVRQIEQNAMRKMKGE